MLLLRRLLLGLFVGLLLPQRTAGQRVIASPTLSTAPPGYSMMADKDCGYPVCATFLHSQVRCSPSCSPDIIAQACNSTPGCQGFNSNGWLKGCLPQFCPRAASGMEDVAGCSLFVRTQPPAPLPPPPPVPDVPDIHYPVAEREENAAAIAPAVLMADASAQRCTLRDRQAEGGNVTLGPGEYAFGMWLVTAIIPPGSGSDGVDGGGGAGENITVVLEARFSSWGMLVYTYERPVPPPYPIVFMCVCM